MDIGDDAENGEVVDVSSRFAVKGERDDAKDGDNAKRRCSLMRFMFSSFV